MAESKCITCGEPFYAHGGRVKRCPECIGERGPRDVVAQMQQSDASRIRAGFRLMNRGD